MNRTGEPGRFEADKRRGQAENGVELKMILEPGTRETDKWNDSTGQDVINIDKEIMDKRVKKSSGQGKNLK